MSTNLSANEDLAAYAKCIILGILSIIALVRIVLLLTSGILTFKRLKTMNSYGDIAGKFLDIDFVHNLIKSRRGKCTWLLRLAIFLVAPGQRLLCHFVGIFWDNRSHVF